MRETCFPLSRALLSVHGCGGGACANFPRTPRLTWHLSFYVIGNVLSGRQESGACLSTPLPSSSKRELWANFSKQVWCGPPLKSSPLGAPCSWPFGCQGAPVSSEPLDVPVFLAEDGDLVFEQDRVQSHLGVHQGHAAKPAGELVHAGLPLGKVVRVGPTRRPGRLLG